VNMTVSRYVLAKWYSQDIKVWPGEMIGSVMENTKKETHSPYEPNEIDYSNSTVLVDVLPVIEKDYADALYASDGRTINNLGIKSTNWPTELKAKFAEIERVQKEQKDLPPVFVSRSGQRTSGYETPMGMPGGMPGMPGGMPGMPGGMMMPGMPGMPGQGLPK
jgi:hypothetical protein